jgi:hypothetical protein
MTAGNERGGPEPRDVREWLGTALAEMPASSAPVDAVRRRGRRMRTRRRFGAAAALAVLVAVAVTVPGLLRGHSTPVPVAPLATPKVTVGHVTSPASHGLIATGTVDGKPWTIRLTAAGMDICVYASGAPDLGCGIEWTQPSWPISFSSAGSVVTASVGTVSAQVSRVDVVLSDGAVLKLDPVRFGRARWIGLEVPRRLTVGRLIAYSRHGVLAYAIPFTEPGGLPIVVNWLTPGEPVPGRVTRVVGAGRSDGTSWSVTVHAGPWGWCAVPAVPGSGGTTGCWPGVPARYGVMLGSGGPTSRPWWIVGAVRSSVSYLAMSLKAGGTVRIPVVEVAGERLYAVAVFRPSLIAGWGAYDARGRRLYGGSGAPS